MDEADLHIKTARMHTLQCECDEAQLCHRKAMRILMGSFIRHKAHTNQTCVEIADAVMKKGNDSETAIMRVESDISSVELSIGHEELVPLLVVLVDDSADNSEQETGGNDPNNDGGGRRKSESSFVAVDPNSRTSPGDMLHR